MLTEKNKTPNRLMTHTLIALLPGIIAMLYFFGYGFLFNVFFTIVAAIITEYICLRLRKIPPTHFLSDMSAVLTALFVALALPPHLPLWLPMLTVFFSITLGKHIYGGLGNNLFNPAMLGYCISIVAFPLHLTTYPDTHHSPFDLHTALNYLFASDGVMLADAMSGATPLEQWRSDMTQPMSFATWQIINLTFLAGGLWLILQQVIRWYIPIAMLAGLSLTLLVFHYDLQLIPLHLLSGATMLGAFFIATDPVTSPQDNKYAMLIFGGLIGFLLAIIRMFGDYADGLAFAVLFMNILVPLLNKIPLRHATT